jgi:hypothetical protein
LPKLLVVDLVFGGLDRVLKKPDLLTHADLAANRAPPPSSQASHLRQPILDPSTARRRSLPAYHRPWLCFMVFLVLVFVVNEG